MLTNLSAHCDQGTSSPKQEIAVFFLETQQSPNCVNEKGYKEKNEEQDISDTCKLMKTDIKSFYSKSL